MPIFGSKGCSKGFVNKILRREGVSLRSGVTAAALPAEQKELLPGRNGVLCLDYTSTTTCAVLTAQILRVCLCVRREGIGKLVQIVQSTSEL